MPELPEVETVVRDLRSCLSGRRLTVVRQASRQALRKRWRPDWNPAIAGQRVESLTRRGKWILIVLENQAVLVVHLGMTGQLTVVPVATPLADHTHLIFDLENGDEQLRFRDIRRFGSVTLFPTRQALEDAFARSCLGPEPFDVPAKYWRECLHGSKRCLKAVLLDQSVVAGVGNIYADESLFEARLHPSRLACNLDNAEADRLRRAVATVLRRAINRRGSSIRNYVGGSGLQGEYQNEFRVYGRTGKPCPRCGAAIESLRLAGRSSHYCPKCQKSETTKHTKYTKKRKEKSKKEKENHKYQPPTRFT
ncbi:MAG TPA: bifunctional DNA-formamidopyrimidine glycosylase/DNA-(apurinic or apyrimidinic site) lyase [Gemmataceae bacterium]|nr:bifunctional DNA-formamidopyrimidine glycosylase/DNA-(apurinic or apyrimidinic site) lyase [Gemmataceae bacterium]